MTSDQARTTANVLMAAAAVAAAVVVLRSPALRRLVWRAAKDYATGPLAVLAATAVRDAWDASGAAGATARADRQPQRRAV